LFRVDTHIHLVCSTIWRFDDSTTTRLYTTITTLFTQGVLVETAEERKSKQVVAAMRQADTLAAEIAYVNVPADTSIPLLELTFRPPHDTMGDALLEHLKPSFAKRPDQSVDVELLKQEGLATTLAGSADVPAVSDNTLQQVASEANVETFSLVHPTPTNNFTGVNIYLDEGTMYRVRSRWLVSYCWYIPYPLAIAMLQLLLVTQLYSIQWEC
jgi:hypothetical protein